MMTVNEGTRQRERPKKTCFYCVHMVFPMKMFKIRINAG